MSVEWQNPVKTFEREDWLDVAVRLVVMLGVGLLGLALGIQLAAVPALGRFCAGLLSAPDGCAAYAAAMNRLMKQAFAGGGGLVALAAVAEVIRDG